MHAQHTISQQPADPPLIHTFADRLKQETASAHHHAETRPLQKQLAAATIEQPVLLAYLSQLLLVHRSLEAAMRETGLADLPDAQHSSNLERDLTAAGVDVDAITALPETLDMLQQLENSKPRDATALGAFYVLEGSMNGNRFIARSWPDRRGQPAPTYLDPYGDAQPATWKRIRAAIDHHAGLNGRIEHVIAAAQQTFAHITNIASAVHAQSPASHTAAGA